jgi:hypothetical protein
LTLPPNFSILLFGYYDRNYDQPSSHLSSTFYNKSNCFNSFGLPNVHSSEKRFLDHETLSIFHEPIGFGDDQQFNHIRQTERGTPEYQFRREQVRGNTESDNPIFPYVAPADVLFNKAGYYLLPPSTGVTTSDPELSQPESTPTTSSASSHGSTLTPKELSLKPRRYILVLASLMPNRKRINTKPPKGNNRFGRKGAGRCTLCRKARQKVSNLLPTG